MNFSKSGKFILKTKNIQHQVMEKESSLQNRSQNYLWRLKKAKNNAYFQNSRKANKVPFYYSNSSKSKNTRSKSTNWKIRKTRWTWLANNSTNKSSCSSVKMRKIWRRKTSLLKSWNAKFQIYSQSWKFWNYKLPNSKIKNLKWTYSRKKFQMPKNK